ncbi:hypothetical protein HFD88_002105 [Aspergillus terreus]|nr:hypothetical protein HFD88_002105 [Aspergillus terreus]
MSRRSSRAVPAAASPAAPAPKRRASARLSASANSEPKRQKPQESSKTEAKPIRSTKKKSKYFQTENSGDSKSPSDPSSEPEDPTSDYDAPASGGSEESPSAEEVASKPKAKQTRAKKAGKAKSESKEDNASAESDSAALEDKQLWKEGVKTGLGPGKEVFIKKPKARDPGDVPYKDHTLHPNTLLFLKDLAKNNERAWLKAHDADYRASKKDWETFVESFTEKVTEIDETVPELPVKDMVFRIHRDIRFSKDPTPYKTHFSAAWSRTGKKGPYAAYYVHCQPGSCFVGAGLWHPEANKLALVRQEIDSNSHRLKAVLNEEGLRREFFGGVDDEEGAVKAFVSQNKESALKTKPMGYDLDNENIQLLRLRSFTIGKPLADEELLSPEAQDRIATFIGILEPFVTYLNSVVMPDSVELDDVSESDDAE